MAPRAAGDINPRLTHLVRNIMVIIVNRWQKNWQENAWLYYLYELVCQHGEFNYGSKRQILRKQTEITSELRCY